jgi:hypothetical protein
MTGRDAWRRAAPLVPPVAAVTGYALLAWALLGIEIPGGTDAIAYWNAGQAVLHGGPLYEAAPGGTSAFLYSPIFAQAVAPLALLPADVFVWAWRALELACLRVAVGSWTRAGIAILAFPPVIIELSYANVDLVIAAICALAMRGRAAGVIVPIVVKLAALPLVPLGVVRDPRGFVVAALGAAVAVAASVLVAPNLWHDFISFLGTAPEPMYWTNLSHGIPLIPRLAVAGVLALLAVRWVRLAPIATVVGLPIVWLAALSILVAVVVPLPARAGGGQPSGLAAAGAAGGGAADAAP